MTDTASLESIFTELDNLMREALAIDAENKRLKERSEKNNAALQALADVWRPDGGKSLLPGVVQQVRTKVSTNYTEVLSWAKADDSRMRALAGVLTTTDDARYVIVEHAITNPSLKAILAVDTKEYDDAVRRGAFLLMDGVPPAEIIEMPVIAVTPKNIKTGTDLRKALGLSDIAPAPTVTDDKSEDVF